MYIYQCYVTASWWQCDKLVTVARDVSIPWNPDKETFTVSTNSVLGSGEEVNVIFIDKDGNKAGTSVVIKFDDRKIRYWIEWCGNGFKPFPTTPTTETQKTWTFTYNYTDKRVVLHCNGVKVLNFVLSESTCIRSTWKSKYEKKPTQIKFNPRWDTASDSYCISSNTGNY